MSRLLLEFRKEIPNQLAVPSADQLEALARKHSQKKAVNAGEVISPPKPYSVSNLSMESIKPTSKAPLHRHCGPFASRPNLTDSVDLQTLAFWNAASMLEFGLQDEYKCRYHGLSAILLS